MALHQTCALVQKAADDAETAMLGVVETRREIKQFHAAVEEIKAGQKRNGYGQWAIGVLVALVGIVVTARTSVQVAEIGAVKAAQPDVKAEQEQQRQHDADQAKLDAKLSELRTMIEQQNRGYPQPLHQTK